MYARCQAWQDSSRRRTPADGAARLPRIHQPHDNKRTGSGLLPPRRDRLAFENRVDRGLRALLTVRAGDAHGPDDLAV